MHSTTPTPAPLSRHYAHPSRRASESAVGPYPAPRKYFAQTSSSKLRITHPYARLYSKKDDTKRRRIWNHALEKSIFSPCELSTLGAPLRRTIYVASLEAHIDQLHTHLTSIDRFPVSPAELEQLRGLNSKTAKSSVSNLQHEVSIARLKLLELERANAELEALLQASNRFPDLRCNL